MKYLTLKQIVMMLVTFIPIVGIQAQTADYMNVYLSSQGSFQSINIDEIDKINEQSMMIEWNGRIDYSEWNY